MAKVNSFDGIDTLVGKDLTDHELERFMANVFGKTSDGGQKSINPSLRTAHNSLPVPEQLLQEVSHSHPNIWAFADAYRQKQINDGHSWPSFVFMPWMDWAECLLQLHPHLPSNPKTIGVIYRETNVLNFIGTWRQTKKIYRFAPALLNALMATSLEGSIPASLLKRMPERAMFIETPGLVDDYGHLINGFGVSIRFSDGASILNLLPIRRGVDGGLCMTGHGVPLDDERPLSEIIEESHRITVASANTLGWKPEEFNASVEDSVRFVSACISLVLWLCSEEPDMAADWKPHVPVGQKTKRGIRHFAADKVTTWDVGVRIGQALDMAANTKTAAADYQGGMHASPRGHVRRAHWHTYKTGPKGSIPVVKWISPILVNLDRQQSLSVMVCPVV